MRWEETPVERWERRQRALAKAERSAPKRGTIGSESVRPARYPSSAGSIPASSTSTDNGTYQDRTNFHRLVMSVLVMFVIGCTAWFVAGLAWLLVPAFLAAVLLCYFIAEWVH